MVFEGALKPPPEGLLPADVAESTAGSPPRGDPSAAGSTAAGHLHSREARGASLVKKLKLFEAVWALPSFPGSAALPSSPCLLRRGLCRGAVHYSRGNELFTQQYHFVAGFDSNTCKSCEKFSPGNQSGISLKKSWVKQTFLRCLSPPALWAPDMSELGTSVSCSFCSFWHKCPDFELFVLLDYFTRQMCHKPSLGKFSDFLWSTLPLEHNVCLHGIGK